MGDARHHAGAIVPPAFFPLSHLSPTATNRSLSPAALGHSNSRARCLSTTTHTNTLLPPHNGIIITRGLQEWACLLPQELPFASVARLLGWQTQETDVLSDTTIRSLVRSHGQNIRQAEHADIVALAAQHDLTTCELQLVPHDQPRRRPGWPAKLNAAVDAALTAEEVCPPEGVSWADWERGKRCPSGRGEPDPRRVAASGAGVRA